MAIKLKPGQHGEIFISEHKDKYRAKVRVCLFDGSETQVSRVGPTGDEARLRVQDAVAERLGAAQGSVDLKRDSRVGTACRQWIKELRVRSQWANPKIRPQTVDEYERLLGNHVVPHLGKLRLYELTPARCQAWIDGIVARGQGKKNDLISTTISARGAFIAVLDRAVVHDALRDNPVRKTIPPARKTPDPKAMTATDVYRLRAAVRAWEASREGQPGPKPTGHLPVAVDVMLGTGMRIGEVMALRWGEVNLSPDGLPTISVEATLTDVKGQGTVRQERPKTDAGERTIIIPPFLAASLESIRPAATTAEMPVFPSRTFRDGRNALTPQTTHNVRRSLRLALKEAKMTGEVYPHLLRKTVATVVARKMSTAVAAALLGHKIDGGVTVRNYIERLRLAPDTSSVLQELVAIGEEEAKKKRRGTTDPETAAEAPAVPDGELVDASGW